MSKTLTKVFPKSYFPLDTIVVEGATLRLLQTCSQYINGVTKPPFAPKKFELFIVTGILFWNIRTDKDRVLRLRYGIYKKLDIII